MLSEKEKMVLHLIEQQPFLSQQEIATTLNMNKSTVGTIIAKLTDKQYIKGRAYIVNSTLDVVCIGGMNLDRKFHLNHSFSLYTSNPASSTWSIGGVARNIAENLGRLNLSVELLSLGGQDQEFDTIKKHSCQYMNFNSVMRLPNITTSHYSAIIDSEGEMVFAIADMSICDEMTPDWLKQFEHTLLKARLLLIDLNLPKETVEYVIHFANQHQIPLVIVPVSAPKMNHLPQTLQYVDWFIVNYDESVAFFKEENTEIQLCQQWINRGIQNIILTHGSKGVWYQSQQTHCRHIACPPVEKVIDATGAGDAFSAGVIYGLLKQSPIEQVIHYGLTNAYHTIQSGHTVRHSLHPTNFEAEYHSLYRKD